jgi:hypothetical protein
VALEKGAEKGDILIADCVTHLLHGAMVALQQAFGGGEPQFLQVDQRAVSGSFFKTADEIAQAHAHAPGRSVERERPVKILVQPLLRAGDRVIGMLGFSTGRPRTRPATRAASPTTGE